MDAAMQSAVTLKSNDVLPAPAVCVAKSGPRKRLIPHKDVCVCVFAICSYGTVYSTYKRVPGTLFPKSLLGSHCPPPSLTCSSLGQRKFKTFSQTVEKFILERVGLLYWSTNRTNMFPSQTRQYHTTLASLTPFAVWETAADNQSSVTAHSLISHQLVYSG